MPHWKGRCVLSWWQVPARSVLPQPLWLLLMSNKIEAAMLSHPPLPRQTKSLHALVQCYNVNKQVSKPQLPTRSNGAPQVRGAAVQGTQLWHIYWIFTSHLLAGSQSTRTCDLANSVFLPYWHKVWTRPLGKSYDHFLVGSPVAQAQIFWRCCPRVPSSHYSTGHEISTKNALWKRGLQRTCRTLPADTTTQPSSHTSLAGGAHWLGEYRRQDKQSWSAPTLTGFNVLK